MMIPKAFQYDVHVLTTSVIFAGMKLPPYFSCRILLIEICFRPIMLPVYNQRHTVIKMKYIDLKTIRMLAGQENYNEAEEF